LLTLDFRAAALADVPNRHHCADHPAFIIMDCSPALLDRDFDSLLRNQRALQRDVAVCQSLMRDLVRYQ